MYLISMTGFFFIGGLFAALIRLELLTPEGDLFQAETYNKLFTMHGLMMIFFFLVPSIPAVLGNFFLPLMLGAEGPGVPKAQPAQLVRVHGRRDHPLIAVIMGGVDTGWTFYTPYSSTYANSYVIAAAVGIFITGFSSILTGMNFIATVHKMRAPGLTWFRLPLFVWAQLRDQPDHGARHAGAGHHDPPGRPRTRLRHRHLRPRPSAATRSCSSTCSGSTRTPRSTS